MARPIAHAYEPVVGDPGPLCRHCGRGSHDPRHGMTLDEIYVDTSHGGYITHPGDNPCRSCGGIDPCHCPPTPTDIGTVTIPGGAHTTWTGTVTGTYAGTDTQFTWPNAIIQPAAATPDPVCFLDTETTGLDAERHEIYEVGLILPSGKQHHWWLPIDLSHADPFALGIGRYHERHPYGYRFKGNADHDPSVVWHGLTGQRLFAREFARLTHKLHICGAVPNFDTERLERLLRSKQEQPGWHYHLIDIEALMAGHLAQQRFYKPPWKSSELSEASGVPMPSEEDRHTALGDARWAKACYEQVMVR